MDEKECLKKIKAGQKDLKTGLFSFKFSPDYMSASENFTEAAKGYKKLKMYQQSIDAYMQAIPCHKKLNDYFSAANCFLDIGEMYLFDLGDYAKAEENLKEASYNLKMGGKYTSAIKVYTDISAKLMAAKDFEKAEKILQIAFDECSEHLEDELVRISFEEVFNQLLDVLCSQKKYKESIKMVDTFIQNQLSYGETNKYKISKNYIRLALLRIANDEMYMVAGIVPKMWELGYEDAHEDIDDLKKLVDAIETLNKKNFTFCMTCAFSLLQNNLLKGVQKAYEKQEKEGPVIGKKIFDAEKVSGKEINIDVNEFNKVMGIKEEDVKKEEKKEEDDDNDLC